MERAPTHSVLERVKSIDFFQKFSFPSYEPPYLSQIQPSEQVKSIDIFHKFSHPSQTDRFPHPIEQEYTAPPPLERAPSLLDRVKSINYSLNKITKKRFQHSLSPPMASSCTHSLLLHSLHFTFFLLTSSSSTESDSLLSFKSSINDPKNLISSWSNTSALHHCNWTGITCISTPILSVLSINLQSLNLSGEISSSICEMPHLSHLNLADNFFNQPIPLHLAQCSSLETLNLSNNLIWGTIPNQVILVP